jgi:hypothetical protein
MRSSTSSSEASAAALARSGGQHRRAIAMTLAGAALFWAGLEATTYFGLRAASKIERRTDAEHAAARALRPGGRGGVPTVLLMGNSLLLEGVEYPRIRKDAEQHVRLTRFAVENTAYNEWYFGIRKLLAEGSRPNVLMLCLSPSQLIGNSIGSDYARHHFFLPGDLYAASRAAGYDLTEASSLAFSRLSFYYARRNTLRSILLSEIAPSYWRMAHALTARAARFPASAEVERIAEERLRALSDEAAKAGSRFVLLIPPGFSEGEREIAAAGARAGVQVMAPIHQREMPASYFSDGFHLNADGARVFTKALGAELAAFREAPATASGGSNRGMAN